MSARFWTPVLLLCVGVLAWSTLPAGAEHFDTRLVLKGSRGTARAEWDTHPPEGGLNRREVLAAAVGEELLLEWEVRSEFPPGVLDDVLIRTEVVREEPGREEPRANAPRVVDNSVIADFHPHHRARGTLRFRVTEPGRYLVRLKSELTLREHGHEHFAAVSLDARDPKAIPPAP